MVEGTDVILADCEAVVGRHHDPSPTAMTKLALAPHSVYAASNRLMTETAALAERLDVRLHTHLAADPSDEEHSRVPTARAR